jgi:hypothetical protein
MFGNENFCWSHALGCGSSRLSRSTRLRTFIPSKAVRVLMPLSFEQLFAPPMAVAQISDFEPSALFFKQGAQATSEILQGFAHLESGESLKWR